MTIVFLALCAVIAWAVVLTLRWWFSGGVGAGHDPVADTAWIAGGFPEAKYQALSRLLDTAELRDLDREPSMPAEVAQRLKTGRREVVQLYLTELEDEFRRAQWLYAHSQATGYVANPKAVRDIVVGWWRFGSLVRKVHRLARRGELTREEVSPMVNETRVWVEKLSGGAGSRI